MPWWGFVIIASVIFAISVAILVWIIMASNSIVILRKKVDRNYPLMSSKIREYTKNVDKLTNFCSKKFEQKPKSLLLVEKFNEKCKTSENTLLKISNQKELEKKLKTFDKIAQKDQNISKSKKFASILKELNEVEGEIEKIIQKHDDCAKIYNKHISLFPTKIIAKRFKFEEVKIWKDFLNQ